MTPPELIRQHAALAQRAAALDVPLWCVAADGTVVGRPAAPGLDGRAWFHSPAFEAEIARLAARAAQGAGAPFEAYAGCWCLPLPVRRGAGRGSWLIGLVWSQAAMGSDTFHQSCRAADLRPDDVAAALAPALRSGHPEVRRTWAALCGAHEDLVESDASRTAISEFNDRLSQAYEEAHLLLGLSRLMSTANDPVRMLGGVCEQIQRVLPFRWVAMGFAPGRNPIPRLAGRLLVGGQLPIGHDEAERLITRLDVTWGSGTDFRLLDPAADPMAARLGGLVVAQPVHHDGRGIGMLLAGGKSTPETDVTSGELQFLAAAAAFVGIYHENAWRLAEQQALSLGTIRALTAAIDAKDPYTRGHSERVAMLAGDLADALGLGPATAERFRVAGLVHDVGKIGVPEAVLCKCGRLDAAEFEMIKRHPEIGHGILKDIPGLADVLPGVLHHHERWDGRGYPHALAGEAIPLVARVLALADAFDAMSSDRSYRKRLSREQVLAEVARCAGTQFDPAVVPAFLRLDFGRFDRMLGTGEAGRSPMAAVA
jgi:HD-GYP domain-containing protein (c-di-GMP phosphodiesterase class II)